MAENHKDSELSTGAHEIPHHKKYIAQEPVAGEDGRAEGSQAASARLEELRAHDRLKHQQDDTVANRILDKIRSGNVNDRDGLPQVVDDSDSPAIQEAKTTFLKMRADLEEHFGEYAPTPSRADQLQEVMKVGTIMRDVVGLPPKESAWDVKNKSLGDQTPRQYLKSQWKKLKEEASHKE